MVEIRDEGAGIPEECRARLFEPFYSTKEGGTGLGLAIARAAVEAAGGRVEIENRTDGRGAVARLTVPRAEEPCQPRS